MSVKVSLKHLHISPRKVRLVASLVRGMDALEARDQLMLSNKKSAKPIRKLLESAIATAKNDFEMKEDNLRIAEIFVDEAPTMKRWRPRAYGRAYPIMKRSSHVTIILEEKVKSEEKKKSKKKDMKDDIIKIEDIKKAQEELRKADKVTEKVKGPAKGPADRKENIGGQKGLIKKMFRRKSG